ncbi:DUF4006 family protein [Sulfurimonas sp.]|nr:DUF4006 family protein [Sulfurimonas sp.]
MTNKERNLLGIHGITGFLLATLGLVIAVLTLAYLAYNTQVENATNFYEVKNQKDIKSGIGGNGSNRADHIIDVK